MSGSLPHSIVTRSVMSRSVMPRSVMPKSALWLAAGLLVAASQVPAHADDAGYRLGIMDKLTIKVVEWQPAEGTVRDWDTVGGEYTVGPTGSVSLPFLGDLPAAGKTTAEVATEIGQELRDKFALRNLPSASVEISQFRPVYLSGDVKNPGEFPFAPNLTVLKAVTLAGGLRRDDSGQRFAKDFINAQGDAVVYDSQRSRLIARRARLQAEMANQSSIAMPAELKNVKNAQQLLDSEASLMKSETDRYQLQLQALANLKQLLDSEVKSLAQKEDNQKRQLAIVSDTRDKISHLTEQGITNNSRLISLEERNSDIETSLLDIDTNTLQAKQQITKADQDEINLRNDWVAQRAQQLQDTDAELEKLTFELTTSRQLMQEAMAQSAEALQFDPSNRSTNLRYTIVRANAKGSQEIAANESTPVQPGDVVKVTSELVMQ